MSGNINKMIEKPVEKNYNYCLKTIELKDNIEAGFLALAERLTKIRDQELYKGSWEDFNAFCEEMRISPSVVSRLVNIHTRLVVEFQIPKETLLSLNGYSDLYDALALAKDKKSTVELIKELAPLSRGDRRKLLTEKRTGVEMVECKHKNTYTLKICSNCGYREKIYNDN